MKALQRWSRWAVARTLQKGVIQRIPERGGFRYLSEAMQWVQDHAELTAQDYAPPDVPYLTTLQYTPAWIYVPGRVPELQRVPHYILYWRHAAASISRPGVWDTDKARLKALADELNLVFSSQSITHRVAEIVDGLEIPWANWDEPVDGSHPLWKMERVPMGIRAVLKGGWLKVAGPPEARADSPPPGDGLGERSMVL